MGPSGAGREASAAEDAAGHPCGEGDPDGAVLQPGSDQDHASLLGSRDVSVEASRIVLIAAPCRSVGGRNDAPSSRPRSWSRESSALVSRRVFVLIAAPR